MNNDFKAGIIGGLVFLGILLCLGLVENTLESSSDKKHLHIADIHIHQIMEHQRAVLIQVEVVHQENHQVQQVLLSIQEPNRLLQVANQQVHHQKSNSSSSSKSSSKKKNYYNSYDDGYDSIYDDGDYDDYRYDRDSDYADGVDDAMDELEW